MKKKTISVELITKHMLGATDNKEKEMIDKIINDDDKSRKEFEAYLDVWEKSADVSDFDKIDADKDWKKVRSRLKGSKRLQRIPLRTYLIRVAAILILALGLAYFFTLIINKSDKVSDEYFEITSLNNTRNIELPDGSAIILNSNSKIIRNDNFGISNRDIILQGEAFFEVSRNESLPFKVYTSNSTIEVLGTSFNVKSETDEVVVGVITGKVAFYQSENIDNRVELMSKTTGVYNTTEMKFQQRNNLEPDLRTWQTGEFHFEKVPIIEASESIARHFKIQLLIDPKVSNTITLNTDISAESVQKTIEEFNLTSAEIRLNFIDNKLILERL
ncbi:MAG: FecR domain-containing protein [Bacteroidales bacterium]|nr:FecR domain-containing protein [Bacteroidales bacterium]